MATLTGKTLGKYQVLERIGRGGMADVYKGLHPRLKRDVAIKVLHSHLAEGPDFLARFEREARAVAALRHPHIVQVYDFDADEDIIYMVMEFIKGGSLKARQQAWVSKGEYMPFKDVIGVINEVGEALDYAHAQTMIHRDVKPANIMLDQNGSAVLTDFGIARIVSDTQFTATGALIGTPAYMSPEQGKGEPLSDESDLYGLGIILYELLTNQIPFDADTPLAIIHKQVNEPLPSARSLRPELPGGVDSVLEKVLAKDPEARYASGAEFTGALMVALDAESMVPGEPAEVEELAPTVVMAETEVEEELEPTVVMEEAEDAVDEGKETTPELSEDIPEAIEGFHPETVEESTVGGDAESSQETTKSGARTRVLIIGGLAIVALLVVLVLSGVFQSGSSDCLSLDECAVMAEEAFGAGDPEAAIGYFDRALDMASGEPHSPLAQLWCMRADAALALDRVDEAIFSFENCIEWTEGDPGLEDLRIMADERIRELSSGAP